MSMCGRRVYACPEHVRCCAKGLSVCIVHYQWLWWCLVTGVVGGVGSVLMRSRVPGDRGKMCAPQPIPAHVTLFGVMVEHPSIGSGRKIQPNGRAYGSFLFVLLCSLLYCTGHVLSAPITSKLCSRKGKGGLRVGGAEMQGFRINMEDAHNIEVQ